MTDDISTLRRILRECRTIAVVGLSAEWHRPSFFAAKYMQQHGYRIVPVNPRYAEVLGERCYASLADIPHAVDMVDVFRRTEDVLPVAAQAIAIGARCLWQQIGVKNLAADVLVRAGPQALGAGQRLRLLADAQALRSVRSLVMRRQAHPDWWPAAGLRERRAAPRADATHPSFSPGSPAAAAASH